MEEKFKQGLANQVFAEFENIKTLREDFIASGASSEHIIDLESSMDMFYKLYLELSK